MAMLVLMLFALIYTLVISVRTLRKNPLKGQFRAKLVWGMALLYILIFTACCLTIVLVDIPEAKKQEQINQIRRQKEMEERAAMRAEAERKAASCTINTPRPSSLHGKFSIQLSPGWSESKIDRDNTTYVAIHKSEKYWLIIDYREEGFGEDACARMTNRMMANIRASQKDAVVGDMATMEWAGRKWMHFLAEMEDVGGRKKEHCYLSSGREGTFIITTVSPVDASKKESDDMESMVKTFKFTNTGTHSIESNGRLP